MGTSSSYETDSSSSKINLENLFLEIDNDMDHDDGDGDDDHKLDTNHSNSDSSSPTKRLQCQVYKATKRQDKLQQELEDLTAMYKNNINITNNNEAKADEFAFTNSDNIRKMPTLGDIMYGQSATSLAHTSFCDDLNNDLSLASPMGVPLHSPSSKKRNTLKLKKQLKAIKPLYFVQSYQQMIKAKETIPKQNHVNDIKGTFTFLNRLAKGGSCSVYRSRHKKNNKIYALKEMKIARKGNPLLFLTETHILRSLRNCSNIITFFDAFIDSNCLYIATEYCSGGTLFSKITKLQRFTEQIAAKAIETILKTLKYIHSKQIFHRDLKPNNIVFDCAGDGGVLKLIDFGEAIMLDDFEMDNRIVGTLPFFTPEMIHCRVRTGKMVMKADMWCLGVISYILLTGKYPWIGKTNKKTIRAIQKRALQWPDHVDLSEECVDFIECLLNKDHTQRWTAEMAIEHEWIRGKAKDRDLGNVLRTFIMNFQKTNKLQRIILNAITAKMNANECTVVTSELLKFNKNRKLLREEDLVEFLILHKVNNKEAIQHSRKIFSKNVSIDLSDGNALKSVYDGILKSEKKENDMSPLYEENDINDCALPNTNMDRSTSEISVEEFRGLVDNVNGIKYNMEAVISNLDPKKTGFIDLKTLSKYSKSINSIEDYVSM